MIVGILVFLLSGPAWGADVRSGAPLPGSQPAGIPAPPLHPEVGLEPSLELISIIQTNSPPSVPDITPEQAAVMALPAAKDPEQGVLSAGEASAAMAESLRTMPREQFEAHSARLMDGSARSVSVGSGGGWALEALEDFPERDESARRGLQNEIFFRKLLHAHFPEIGTNEAAGFQRDGRTYLVSQPLAAAPDPELYRGLSDGLRASFSILGEVFGLLLDGSNILFRGGDPVLSRFEFVSREAPRRYDPGINHARANRDLGLFAPPYAAAEAGKNPAPYKQEIERWKRKLLSSEEAGFPFLLQMMSEAGFARRETFDYAITILRNAGQYEDNMAAAAGIGTPGLQALAGAFSQMAAKYGPARIHRPRPTAGPLTFIDTNVLSAARRGDPSALAALNDRGGVLLSGEVLEEWRDVTLVKMLAALIAKHPALSGLDPRKRLRENPAASPEKMLALFPELSPEEKGALLRKAEDEATDLTHSASEFDIEQWWKGAVTLRSVDRRSPDRKRFIELRSELAELLQNNGFSRKDSSVLAGIMLHSSGEQAVFKTFERRLSRQLDALAASDPNIPLRRELRAFSTRHGLEEVRLPAAVRLIEQNPS